MNKALLQASLGLKNNEVPVGAVIVDRDGNIIARAYNKIEAEQCQLAHAEARAIKKACKKVVGWRLNGCWIYVTLEPCLMCFGLIKLSRLEGVVFGAQSNLFGIGLHDLEKVPHYAKDIKIIGGIQEKECVGILKKFFNNVRKKRKAERETKRSITR